MTELWKYRNSSFLSSTSYQMLSIAWEDIKIELEEPVIGTLLNHWDWLVPADLHPILVSSIGDMWLKDNQGQVFWLNVGVGCLEKVASTETEFIVKLNDDQIANEWFMFELIQALKDTGVKRASDELFGYILLPIIGGKYTVNNFELTSVEKHFAHAGQIHRQLRDLPDGTEVNIDFQ